MSCTNLVPYFISLPAFNDVSSTPSRFKPGTVYQQRRPLPLPSFEPPPDLVLHEPCLSTRVSRPPNWYGSSSSALLATLHTTFVPESYSQASTQEC